MDRPPDRRSWAIQGELEGHSPQETFDYLARCSDWSDDQAELRRKAAMFVGPDESAPWWSPRRWFGRSG